VDLLWEGSCAAWGINNIRTNSSMQLFSADLTTKSNPIFFNEAGRDIVLQEAPKPDWAGSSASQ